MIWSVTIVCGCLLLAGYFILHRIRAASLRYRFFDNGRIPHEPSGLFYNSRPKMYRQPLESAIAQQKYGPVHGRFVGGPNPFVVCANNEAISGILTRHFGKFVNRSAPVENSARDPQTHNILTLRGDTWRRVRQAISPAFATSRIKAMNPLMDKAARDLVDEMLRRTAGKEVIELESLPLLQAYTVQVGMECFFDTSTNCIKDSSSVWLRGTVERREWAQLGRYPLITMLRKPLAWLRILSSEHPVWHIQCLMELLAERRRQYQSTTEGEQMQTPGAAHLAIMFKGKEKHRLSDYELKSQQCFFIATSMSLPRNAIAFACHCLATNPEEQHQLHEDLLANGDESCYLDMVIREAFRLYSPVPALHREVLESSVIPGIDIELHPGMTVQIPTWEVHRNEQFYDDPLSFKPSRWASSVGQPFERDQSNAWFPFGGGPRMCIGKQYAVSVVRRAVAAIVLNFKLGPSEKNREQLGIVFKHGESTPNAVWLSVMRRASTNGSV